MQDSTIRNLQNQIYLSEQIAVNQKVISENQNAEVSILKKKIRKQRLHTITASTISTLFISLLSYTFLK